MHSLAYLYQRTIINRVKRALKRPGTYLILVAAAAYAVMVFYGFDILVEEIASPENFAILVSVLIVILIPADIIAYARRRGLLFRPADVHLVFPAPHSAKRVILYAGVKGFLGSLLVGIFLALFGAFSFHLTPWRMFFLALVFAGAETLLEGSLMIFFYGSERLTESKRKGIVVLMYTVIAVFLLTAVMLIAKEGMSFQTVRLYLEQPLIQLLPVIGWLIALVRLVVLGPTVLNLTASALYFAVVLLMALTAWRMKCQGEYYEDATKFAQAYAEAKQRSKNGEVAKAFGKKKKFKKASVTYKGHGARAMFYRQLLEYKKCRFFIFDGTSAICLLSGAVTAVAAYKGELLSSMGDYRVFLIPGIMAYIILIFSAYLTKWAKELKNPYTFLIPDTSVKKIWYATVIEHIRAFIDGCTFTLPGAFVLKLSPAVTALTVMFYVCLCANRLYMGMLAEALLGERLGAVGRNMLKMLLQGLTITVGALTAVAGGIFFGFAAGFGIMILVTGILTFAGFLGASCMFQRMEPREA